MNAPSGSDLAVLIARLPGLPPASAPAGRHAAPDVGFDPDIDYDPDTDVCRLRAAWETAHGRLPDRARSHRYVQIAEVAR